ncbi:transmembrane protein, putative (macronuclear) [Tetrahymena thermophila SB210]|uniref:Transmembrane protein, putative n=1 Tax=Tetrahymena thermophila (strain SB210) TaxID=312017 RepID=Q22UY6_TETTS|nr:transmembrane protein, putative [Tetrahymena thermophila SB210]EAR89162.1 transmembrane protein, putative [Tetrahymena thermophila SB210]|eukprot:XP_001009407.1 transmembrane protein, putative [Tetrahymena thermophila SB210]
MKRNLTSFCLALALINLTLAQSLTVPLSANQNGKLFFTLKYSQYGFKDCQVNFIPSISDCTNVVTQTAQEAKECGSVYIGPNTQVQGDDYLSTFQIGDQLAQITYTAPNQQSSFYGENELCFSILNGKFESNALDQLFKKQLISEKQVFFSLNAQQNLNQPIPAGRMDIGAPDTSLIKQGSNLVYLKNFGLQNIYSAPANRDLKFGDVPLSNVQVAEFDIESRFHILSIFTFPSLLQAFESQGIEYTYQNDNVFLPSIEKLQDITLSLVDENNQPFIVRLQPSYYTQQLPNGQYLLLFKKQIRNAAIIFGNAIFESYYIGFNKDKQQIIIAEKEQQQNSSQI